jgi:CRP/FNR family transcriptional regulator
MVSKLDWPMAQVTDLYPSLQDVQPSLSEVSAVLQPMTVPADTVLFSENAACQGFPLVLDGEIKVSRHSGDGRSLELYRVVPGELCLVSSASLFRPQPLSAFGITTRRARFCWSARTCSSAGSRLRRFATTCWGCLPSACPI